MLQNLNLTKKTFSFFAVTGLWALAAQSPFCFSQEDYNSRIFANGKENGSVSALSQDTLEFVFETKEAGTKPHHFHEMHEKPLHALLISKDLNHFYHFHPEYNHHASKPFKIVLASPTLDADNFQIKKGILDGGDYFLFTEFMPMDEAMQLSRAELRVVGTARSSRTLSPDALVDANTIVKYFNDQQEEVDQASATFKAELKINKFLACRFYLPHLTLRVQKKNGENGVFEDVKDLSTWLGVFGHAVMIGQEGKTASEKTILHMHAVYPIPDEGPSGTRGPVIKLAGDSHGLPVVGDLYKTWIQFKHQDKVYTWDFTFNWNPQTLSALKDLEALCFK